MMGRPVLRTPLCELLGIEYPIMLAGMGAGNEGGAAGPELVAAVSEAGGLGVLGGTGHDVDEFREACAQIRRLTKKPFGVDLLLPSFGAAPTSRTESVDQRYWDWVDATAARATGRDDLAMQLGGQIAGAIREIRPAHVVLDEMVREAIDVLLALSRTRVTFAMA